MFTGGSTCNIRVNVSLCLVVLVDFRFLSSGGTLEVDSYIPAIHNALIASVEVHPSNHFIAGEAVLRVEFIRLPKAEMVLRKGGKFKVVGVRSC